MSQKLANQIWELNFIEMDELLPSNRVFQALEGTSAHASGGARSSAQSQFQSRHTTDAIAWIRCLNMYMVVMAQKNQN